MSEPQARGMQAEAAEGIMPAAVLSVSEDRVATFGELDADLMPSARLERQVEHTHSPAPLPHAIAGDGDSTAGA
jgi:hypothetical protein